MCLCKAWEETFKSWESATQHLKTYPKTKVEDSQNESFYRNAVKRRTSHQNSEHELEEQVIEWANMTGFLCALAGVCLPHRSSTRPTSGLASNSDVKKKYQDGLTNSNQIDQYSPVVHFVHDLLPLLVISNEKFGAQIQKHVKEYIGYEMSPALYPLLFDEIKSIVEKFFDQHGQVISQNENTLFIEHTIFIIKNILDSKLDRPSEYLGMTSIEGMILAIVRYVRQLDMTGNSTQIKIKLCQLVEVLMKHRDDLAFRQEMKFRNKLVEYLTDWVMGTAHQITSSSNSESSYLSR